MSLIHWHPLKEFNNLRQEINALFEEITHRHHGLDDWEVSRLLNFDRLPERVGISWSPAIDFKETETELILKVELPGIEAKDLDIQLSDRMVSIVGERKEEKHHQEKGRFCSEFSYGKFQRIVPLPSAIDKNNVKAKLKDGLLTLAMSKNKSAIAPAVKVDLIEAKARQAMVEQRQDREHQQETMHERAIEELTELENNDKNIQEEAREVMVEQRQQEKHQQQTMQVRATEEVSK
jgi:HSP20 family protein